MQFRDALNSLDDYGSKAHLLRMRDANLEGARDCLATLTDPNGYWRYSPDELRVRKAVAYWVSRAKRCHAIAMGRKPLYEAFVTVTNDRVTTGPVYVQQQ